MWKTTMHSHAMEVDGRLRASIEQQMLHALGGLGQHIGHVHVRLYGEVGGTSLCTCYVRVDFVPSGGVALARRRVIRPELWPVPWHASAWRSGGTSRDNPLSAT